MARNPYERRGQRPRADMTMAFEGLGRPHFEVRPAIAIEDLDAMVQSAMRRAEGQARVRLSATHQDELAHARREAWQEGRNDGDQEGRNALLRSIDEQHGESVRTMIDELGQLAEVELGKDGDAVAANEELRHALRAAVQQLERLVEAHHDAFQERPPI